LTNCGLWINFAVPIARKKGVSSMPIKYSVVTKKNPQNLAAPPRYYPVVKSSGRSSLRVIAQKSAQMSTLTAADLAAVVEVFLAVIPQELLDGRIVELGPLGSLHVTITASGADNPEDVSARHIKGLNVRFVPGKEFLHALETAVFEKV